MQKYAVKPPGDNKPTTNAAIGDDEDRHILQALNKQRRESVSRSLINASQSSEKCTTPNPSTLPASELVLDNHEALLAIFEQAIKKLYWLDNDKVADQFVGISASGLPQTSQSGLVRAIAIANKHASVENSKVNESDNQQVSGCQQASRRGKQGAQNMQASGSRNKQALGSGDKQESAAEHQLESGGMSTRATGKHTVASAIGTQLTPLQQLTRAASRRMIASGSAQTMSPEVPKTSGSGGQQNFETGNSHASGSQQTLTGRRATSGRGRSGRASGMKRKLSDDSEDSMHHRKRTMTHIVEEDEA